ncbi:type ISP restriction/modification enzyme [Anabaena sp. CCY 0017]|uniref:type ISP restriction/modification enzyme n=1 Tax=Anabaena sp. CCY 0017 TaxID=3103866 RepID=UPI0039C6AF22
MLRVDHRPSSRGARPCAPTPETEQENQVICLTVGIFISKFILALNFAFEKAQCLPFYNYDEDGTNRKEDITDWALKEYRNHYQYTSITNDSNRLDDEEYIVKR